MKNKKINHNQLLITTSNLFFKKIEFLFDIRQIEEINDIVIVRLDIPLGVIFNENIYAVSADGEILWQIPKMSHVYEDSPYVNMLVKGENIELYNWDGTILLIEPATGKILEKGYTK